MRLLQGMAGGIHGGAEAFFERLASAFQRAGLEQRVLIRRDGARAAKLRAGGVEVVELGFGGRLDFATRRAFARQITEFRPHVVLTWMNRATRFCPRSRAVPFVHVARLGGYYNLKYYRNCRHLVGNTRDIVRYLVAEGWPAERAHYLPNFVDGTPLPAEPRGAHDTPEDAPLLLALGRLHANKAFDLLIEALAGIPGAYLWIAGEGTLGNALTEQAVRAGVADRLRLLGWRDDAPALLAAADILVCPSRIEPLGNVVIEGWAQGTPVVATESAGPKALIAPEETGLLVPLEDAGALAGQINRLLAEPSLGAKLAGNGRTAFEASFTEDAIVAQYRALFEEVTG